MAYHTSTQDGFSHQLVTSTLVASHTGLSYEHIHHRGFSHGLVISAMVAYHTGFSYEHIHTAWPPSGAVPIHSGTSSHTIASSEGSEQKAHSLVGSGESSCGGTSSDKGSVSGVTVFKSRAAWRWHNLEFELQRRPGLELGLGLGLWLARHLVYDEARAVVCGSVGALRPGARLPANGVWVHLGARLAHPHIRPATQRSQRGRW